MAKNNTNIQLFASLNTEHIQAAFQRYLFHVIHCKVLIPQSVQDLNSADTLVAITESDEVDNSLLKHLHEHPEQPVIRLSYLDRVGISLLDLSNLKKHIALAIKDPNSIGAHFYSSTELISSLKPFFRSHGENSAIKSLNYLKYYLQNGIRLYQSQDIDWRTAYDNFLSLALKSWQDYTKKFEYFRPHFDLLELTNECDHLLKMHHAIESFGKSKKYFRDENAVLKISEVELSEMIHVIEKIYSSWEKISKTLEIEVS